MNTIKNHIYSQDDFNNLPIGKHFFTHPIGTSRYHVYQKLNSEDVKYIASYNSEFLADTIAENLNEVK